MQLNRAFVQHGARPRDRRRVSPLVRYGSRIWVCGDNQYFRILANQHFPSDVIVGQAIGFLTGTYVLNHRAVSRMSRESMTARLLDSMNPIADARTHTFGASMEIPLRR